MENEMNPGVQAVLDAETADTKEVALITPKIGVQQLREFTKILEEYKTGKASTDARVIAAENWWKLKNNRE